MPLHKPVRRSTNNKIRISLVSPKEYGPYAWYDSSQVNGLNQPLPAAGAEILQWNDISGNNRHLYYVTVANGVKLIYRYNIHANGMPSLQAPGGACVYRPSPIYQPAPPYTLFYVMRYLSGAGPAVMFHRTLVGNFVYEGAYFSTNSSSTFSFQNGTVLFQPYHGATNPNPNGFGIWSQMLTGTDAAFQAIVRCATQDGVSVSSSPTWGPLNSTTQGRTLSVGSISGTNFGGYISEVILFNRALSSVEYLNIEKYLHYKYKMVKL